VQPLRRSAAEVKRALIFDFDGLILDTEWPEYVAWSKVFKDLGLTLAMEDWMHVVGGPDQFDFRLKVEALLGRKPDWASIDASRIDHHRTVMAEQEILPGVRELMIEASAKGWAIGVASSSSRDWVYGNLRRLGLDSWIETLRTRDNTPKLKPSPDPYLLACKDLDADPKQSIAFEDSATGVAAAKAAGMTVVAVPNRITVNHDLSAADQIVKSLEHYKLPA
jgi:HAD superfamily hydrolase (TIGR01509 family)